ncbi:MAG: hypothetical protein FWF90_13930 [Promicromonosporaceae bacterium]|nr:hypothetical protein [Promicromonosporaceae bacterium]
MRTGSRPPEPGPITTWPGTRPIVWAPAAHTVDVVVVGPDGAGRHPMRLVGAERPGFWGADAELEPGTMFGFSVDGAPPVADPAGSCFPDGVDGLSEVPQPLTGWTDDAWQPPDLSGGVLLHLDIATATPAGTLDAAIDLLPDVVACGAQGVELAPLAAYDPATGPAAGVRLFAVHGPLGGSRALARFVDAAHAQGLAVALTPPHRWAATPRLGLDRFGPYATGGHLNLDGPGNRGVRDFLVADALRWFEELHVDALSLDVEALTHRTSSTFLTDLANATLAAADRTGRALALFVDGPGRSDRLTGLLGRVLTEEGPDPVALGEMGRLARTLTPTARLPLRAERWARGPHPLAPRAASIVVGDLTRLPGARVAMPWSRGAVPVGPRGLDTRASVLAFALLAGTPLVLDVGHVPVGSHDAGDRRLIAWCAELARLRAATAGDLALGVELGELHGALVARRGRTAVVVAPGAHDVRLPLSALPGAPGTWSAAAAWSAGAAVADDVLTLPASTTAVLSAQV